MGLIASESSLFIYVFQFVFKRIVLCIRRHSEVKLVFIPLLVAALKIWVDFLVWLADEPHQFSFVNFRRLLGDEAVVLLSILEDVFWLFLLLFPI